MSEEKYYLKILNRIFERFILLIPPLLTIKLWLAYNVKALEVMYTLI